MLLKCQNILKRIQKQMQNGYTFSSHYQYPAIDELGINQYQRMCIDGTIVDKSKFIQRIHEIGESVLITRPDKSGKSFGLMMLSAFYGYTENAQVQQFNKTLFLGGDIVYQNKKYTLLPQEVSQYTDLCNQHLGQYPIIHISLANQSFSNKQAVLSSLQSSIAQAYYQHRHLFDRIKVDEISRFTQGQEEQINYQNLNVADIDRLYRKQIKFANKDSSHADKFLIPNKPPSELDIQNSISDLATILTTYYNKPACILLIDDYDCPFDQLSKRQLSSIDKKQVNYFQNMIDSIFQYGVKRNSKIHQTIVVGTKPITQEYLYDGWNFLTRCTVDSRLFNEDFGFTQKQVDREINKLPKLSNVQKAQLREGIYYNFDGYTIGGAQVYNAYAIDNCLRTVNLRGIDNPEVYQPFNNLSSILQKLEIVFKNLSKTELHDLVNQNQYSIIRGQPIMNLEGCIQNCNALKIILWSHGYLTQGTEGQLRISNLGSRSGLINSIYEHYLNSIHMTYNKMWNQLENYIKLNSYIKIINEVMLPKLNIAYQLNNQDIPNQHFIALLSACRLNSRILYQEESETSSRTLDMIYSPYVIDGTIIIIHELRVIQEEQSEEQVQNELEQGLWELFGHLQQLDNLQNPNTHTNILICRVLLFTKTKIASIEQYAFDGLTFQLPIEQVPKLIALFANVDGNVMTRKRKRFLKQNNVKSLIELFRKHE